MKITAVTKLKNAVLLEALRKARWTNSELARRIGMSPTHIGVIINLKIRPTQETLEKMVLAFAEAGVFLDVLEVWPEREFKGFARQPQYEQTKDIDAEKLAAYAEYKRLEGEGQDVNLLPEYGELLDEALTTLKERERAIVEYLHSKAPEPTLAETGRVFHLTRECIRQIEAKAMRKLRRIMSKPELPDYKKMLALMSKKG